MVGDTHERALVVDLMISRGGLATLSILCHEIPHELGDFEILVKNGFSKRQAIVAQFGTAVAALLETVVGIGLESLLFVTAGGFVYLAAVSILPEILEEPDTSLKFRVLQLLCFGAGVAFMYAVTLLERMGNGGEITMDIAMVIINMKYMSKSTVFSPSLLTMNIISITIMKNISITNTMTTTDMGIMSFEHHPADNCYLMPTPMCEPKPNRVFSNF
jgi:hypothetical protein